MANEGGQDASVPVPKSPDLKSQLPETASPSQSDENFRLQNPEKDYRGFPRVTVGENRLGYLIPPLPGKTVQLKDIFQEAQESYPDVYFRTANGNIYQLTREGDSIKLRDAKHAGADDGPGFDINTIRPDDRISIGKRFMFISEDGSYTKTSPVSEVIIVESRTVNDQNRLAKLPTNTIAEDFESIVVQVRGQSR